MRIKNRQLLIALLFAIASIAAAGCQKRNSPTNKLPPETRDGLNTMGCLVNGHLFIPQAPSWYQTPFSVAYLRNTTVSDLGFNWIEKTGCGISAIYISLDSIDLAQGTTYTLGPSPYPDTSTSSPPQYRHFTYARISPDAACNLGPSGLYTTTAQVTGQLTIDYYNTTRMIVAGHFDMDLTDGNGDTCHIREGRFDMTYTPF
jgi:hypothetical protein